jgi:hypothetical protein
MLFRNGKKMEFWAQEKSLSILFIILSIHIFVIVPFGQKTFFQSFIFLFFYMVMISAGIIYMFNSIITRVLLFSILAFMLVMGSGISGTHHSMDIINDITIAAFCLILGIIVLMRTFGKGPVTLHRILGAIVVYLLISFIFALLFHSLFIANGSNAFRGLIDNDREEFMYFSLTTLTTTGYGDIIPVNAATRSLSNLESLIGQLYPAILISRLVTLELEYSRKK